MAIIYSYPEKTTPAGGDFLVITDSEQPAPKKNRTKSLTIDNLASYISTSIGAITGSGTLNTIAMFTPDGKAIGNSMITQNSNGSIATVAGRLAVNTDLFVTGYSRFNGQVQDGSSSPGTTGQVLTSTGTGVEWDDASDVVSGAVAKLIPYTTTATPGGSETYTELNNIVKIGWSGGNGIYVLNLPSATTIPYRVIRFVTNGTYPGGGAHKVRFTATGGETIDGAAFFETSKVYEGIAIWSTGTEWVIIQAKAH
jgi:hypothetical protein